MAGREIEHFARSDEDSEGGGSLDHVAGVKAGREVDPEIDSVARGPNHHARNAAVRDHLRDALAPRPIRVPGAIQPQWQCFILEDARQDTLEQAGTPAVRVALGLLKQRLQARPRGGDCQPQIGRNGLGV